MRGTSKGAIDWLRLISHGHIGSTEYPFYNEDFLAWAMYQKKSQGALLKEIRWQLSTWPDAAVVKPPVPIVYFCKSYRAKTRSDRAGHLLGGGASLTVTSRNCTQEGLVVGISPSSSDPCGSVECECFKGIYFCYSTCSAPAADQTCDAVVPAGGSDLCPQYSNCGKLCPNVKLAKWQC